MCSFAVFLQLVYERQLQERLRHRKIPAIHGECLTMGPQSHVLPQSPAAGPRDPHEAEVLPVRPSLPTLAHHLRHRMRPGADDPPLLRQQVRRGSRAQEQPAGGSRRAELHHRVRIRREVQPSQRRRQQAGRTGSLGGG